MRRPCQGPCRGPRGDQDGPTPPNACGGTNHASRSRWCTAVDNMAPKQWGRVCVTSCRGREVLVGELAAVLGAPLLVAGLRSSSRALGPRRGRNGALWRGVETPAPWPAAYASWAPRSPVAELPEKMRSFSSTSGASLLLEALVAARLRQRLRTTPQPRPGARPQPRTRPGTCRSPRPRSLWRLCPAKSCLLARRSGALCGRAPRPSCARAVRAPPPPTAGITHCFLLRAAARIRSRRTKGTSSPMPSARARFR